MIIFDNVSKTYDLVSALADVSFEIEKGCTGLLGPNGSGKTTSLRLIIGFLRPDNGTVTVNGEDPHNNPKVLRMIGYVPEFDEPYPWMTAYKYLKWVAKMRGFTGKKLSDTVNYVVKNLGIERFKDREINGYSRGMKQRVKIAQALIGEPEILLLDEPLVGLDPLWRLKILSLIKDWKKEGKTVVYSTHLLFEAEKTCNYIIFLYKGNLIGKGSINELKRGIRTLPHEIKLEVANGLKDLLNVLLQEIEIEELLISNRKGEEGIIRIKTRKPEVVYNLLPKISSELGVLVREMEVLNDNLDAIYRMILNVAKGEVE